MARKEATWRNYLTERQLTDTEASLDLNKLCWYCQKLCAESNVLNDLRWHRPFQSEMPSSRRRSPSASFLARSEDQKPVEGVTIIHEQSLGNYNYRPEHHLFHPNGESLLSSVQAGCHLCTLLCWTAQLHGQSSFVDISQSFRVVVDRDTFNSVGEETHYILSLQNDALGDPFPGMFCRLFSMHKQQPSGRSLLSETES